MSDVQQIGITERGDPAFDKAWVPWVEAGLPAVLITKNFPEVKKIAKLRENVVYHATITGWGGTVYEPGVPDPDTVLDALNDVPKTYRPHVVVRIDPIIPFMHFMKRAIPIYNWAVANGFQTRISFMDFYPHVRERFDQASLSSDEVRAAKEILDEEYTWGLHASLAQRKHAYETHFPDAVLCGEPGLPTTGCISKETCDILGVPFVEGLSGQRQYCACCGLKRELLTSPKRCPHGCLVCYWK